jgi:hypothetical protein
MSLLPASKPIRGRRSTSFVQFSEAFDYNGTLSLPIFDLVMVAEQKRFEVRDFVDHFIFENLHGKIHQVVHAHKK